MPQLTLDSVSALTRAHAALLKDLQRLEKSLSLPDPENVKRCYDNLDVVIRRLTEHFRLEEEDGYMQVVRDRSPHLEPTIDKLKEEHTQLLRMAKDLGEVASTGRRIDETFRAMIGKFIERVRDHEKRENILIEDVLNQDFGNED